MTNTRETDIAEKIKIISINDSKEEQEEPTVPNERQIVDEITAMWKEDPSSESLGVGKLYMMIKRRRPHWTVSEKRVKMVLRSNGLLTTGGNEPFVYADQITSKETPKMKMPSGVKIRRDEAKGKGLYASKNAREGDLMWKEHPLFFIPPLVNINLIKLAKACSYCGNILTNSRTDSSGAAFLQGLDCGVCSEVWCSTDCKKRDTLHGQLKHNSGRRNSANKLLSPDAFLKLQDYCLKEQWNTLYAVVLIYAYIITDDTGTKGEQFWSMAQVSQDTRHKALTSSAGAFDTMQGGALSEENQQEELWRKGHELFVAVFPNAEVSYVEFMLMMGIYNLNNYDSNIYLLQSHVNHSCDANISIEVSTVSRTQGIKVYAKTNIKAGKELTISYVSPSHTVQQRQRELRVNWGFICNCEKCKDDLKIQQRRKSSGGGSHKETKTEIMQMLAKTKEELEDTDLTLNVPTDHSGERRKSVRFDEKVVSVEK